MNPLVSICLPNLNTRRFLPARMESILSQTLTDWELIISDNYSEDGAWEYFGKYKDDPRITLSQAPRRGMYANWNNCLRQAKGQYIYIATSDDTMHPALLGQMVNALEMNPDIDLAICRFDWIDTDGGIIHRPESDINRLYGNWLNTRHRRAGSTEFLRCIARL